MSNYAYCITVKTGRNAVKIDESGGFAVAWSGPCTHSMAGKTSDHEYCTPHTHTHCDMYTQQVTMYT